MGRPQFQKESQLYECFAAWLGQNQVLYTLGKYEETATVIKQKCGMFGAN